MVWESRRHRNEFLGPASRGHGQDSLILMFFSLGSRIALSSRSYDAELLWF